MSKVLRKGAGDDQKGAGDGRKPRPQIPSAGREGRVGFIKQVWEELKKTTWPNREELIRMTGIVIATVLIFSAMIGIADFGLGKIAGSLYTGGSNTSAGAGASANPTPRLPASSSAQPSTSAKASPTGSASPSATSSAGTKPATATPSPGH